MDDVCATRLREIWDAKVAAMAAISAAKRRRKIRQAEDEAGDAEPPAIEDAGANDGEEKTANFPGVLSSAFLGGTIERVRERCAGDCAAVRQTKAALRLPGVAPDFVARDLPDLVAPEKAMALAPGMQGRAWYGQSLVFDEAYQFLQDLSILDQPQKKKASETAGAGRDL